MATQIQFRKGTKIQHASFTGANAEVTVNTTDKTLHVHDGSTVGGIEAARTDLANVVGVTSLSVSGITTVGSLSIDANEVISSARQLKNIASLDATTTATIESAIAAAPNDFTNLNVTGISTLGNTVVGGATTQLIVTGNARVTGIITVGTSSITLDGVNNRIAVGSGLTITESGITIGPTTINSSGSLSGTAGTITTFDSTSATITNGTITNLTGTAGTITTFNSTNGTITNLTGIAGTITNGTITNLTGTAGTITTFNSTNGTITNGTITNLTGTAGTVTTFNSTVGSITNLTSTNVNASGIVTATTAIVGAATTINATGVNATGIVTAAQFVTGASGSAIGINTNTISGPATIVIDPAGVGDNTGAVRIKGDLLVDGTQFIVNSTTIELADFIVGIASTATTDALADGAGIKIGPDNTLTYDNSNTALKSSENLNLASGKTYKINGTDVLSATTLGNAVVSSSLTSLGTIASLVATNGTITNLTGTAGTITNGTITNLTGTAGTITNLTSTNGTITNLTGTAGTITNLTSTNGTITNLTSTNVNASGIVTATTAIVGAGVTIDSSGINAGITSVTAGLFFGQNLDVGDAFVGIATIGFLNSTDINTIELNSTSATITNGTITNLTGTAGTITTFNNTDATITNATITNLTGTAGTITTFSSTNGTITNLTGTAGTITTFNSTDGTITNGTITNLTGTAGTITTFDSTSATITNLTSTNTNASGISTVGSLSIDANEVISSARQLKNIASLDATTTATIESAIAAGPNNFTDLTITGFSTFTNGPVVIGTATSTGTASQRLQVTGGAYISGDVGIGNTLPSFKADIAGDARITSTNKMRFGGTTESTNFYIAYNSTTNSLDFVQG